MTTSKKPLVYLVIALCVLGASAYAGFKVVERLRGSSALDLVKQLPIGGRIGDLHTVAKSDEVRGWRRSTIRWTPAKDANAKLAGEIQTNNYGTFLAKRERALPAADETDFDGVILFMKIPPLLGKIEVVHLTYIDSVLVEKTTQDLPGIDEQFKHIVEAERKTKGE